MTRCDLNKTEAVKLCTRVDGIDTHTHTHSNQVTEIEMPLKFSDIYIIQSQYIMCCISLTNILTKMLQIQYLYNLLLVMAIHMAKNSKTKQFFSIP